MASGTVKWFNGQKGYGFIAPDGGGKDVFVHISAVEKAGLDGLPDGAKVTFDIVPNRGKESAENLRVMQPTLWAARRFTRPCCLGTEGVHRPQPRRVRHFDHETQPAHFQSILAP